MLSLLLLIIYFQCFRLENLVFPFKKLTIEYLNETKTIADFIDFNLYTNISMGTPQKNVAHFITKSDKSFYYDTLQIHYHGTSEYDRIQKEIENSINICYFSQNSTSFEILDDYFGAFSEFYYLYDLNQKEKTGTLNFNMLPNEKNLKLYGTLDLYYQKREPYDQYNIYIFEMFKEHGFIDGYYFTFIYEEYDLTYNFNYLNDNYDNLLGNLVLGESPHEFARDKYKAEDEIKINGIFALDINEVKFKSQKLNFSETDIKLYLEYNSDFIEGSKEYKNAIDSLFFNELFENEICQSEIVNENIYISSDIVYSCENNEIIREKIKYFPTLYLEIKQYNLTFLFNHKELFKLHNNRIYFLILFKYNGFSNGWDMGELFFRKYITSFNFDSKTISFYKAQVDEINEKTDISPDEDHDEESEEESKEEFEEESEENAEEEEPKDESEEKSEESEEGDNKGDTYDDNSKDKNRIWIIIGITGGVLLIAAVIIIVLLVLRLKKFRKKRADELIDEDYDYSPRNEVN